MNTSDTTVIVTRRHIYQVTSGTNYLVYYFINKDKDTTLLYIICRITEDMYKPRIKMRTTQNSSIQLRKTNVLGGSVSSNNQTVYELIYQASMHAWDVIIMHVLPRTGQHAVVQPAKQVCLGLDLAIWALSDRPCRQLNLASIQPPDPRLVRPDD